MQEEVGGGMEKTWRTNNAKNIVNNKKTGRCHAVMVRHSIFKRDKAKRRAFSATPARGEGWGLYAADSNLQLDTLFSKIIWGGVIMLCMPQFVRDRWLLTAHPPRVWISLKRSAARFACQPPVYQYAGRSHQHLALLIYTFFCSFLCRYTTFFFLFFLVLVLALEIHHQTMIGWPWQSPRVCTIFR